MISTLGILLRSLYFCIKYLPLNQAIHLPILVTSNLKEIKMKKGQLVLKKVQFKQVVIGYGKSPGKQASYSGLLLGDGGQIIFMGKASISQGVVLRCDKNASIVFGDTFYCNCNCFIRSTSEIHFGNNCLLGWGITINTTDGHKLWRNGNEREVEGPIIVGEHVWIASDCTLGKNVLIADGCVIAQKSLVTKAFSTPHCLIGGIPAKILSTNVDWRT